MDKFEKSNNLNVELNLNSNFQDVVEIDDVETDRTSDTHFENMYYQSMFGGRRICY